LFDADPKGFCYLWYAFRIHRKNECLKFYPIKEMNAPILKNALLIAFIIISISGCQVIDAPEQMTSTMELAERRGQTCNVGETRYFALGVNSNPGMQGFDADYGVSLYHTPLFSDQHCLCRFDQYVINFDWLPTDFTEITVSDNNQTELDFIPSIDPATGEGTIIVLAHSVEDASIAIYIDFSNNVPPTPTAGGLCIVDNIDGNDPYLPSGIFYNVPLWIYNKPPTGPTINKIFIPTAMTTS
jgi:hypothetical protein